MDISTNQLGIFLPVGVVIAFALLIFAFGFKSSVEPPSFKHIDSTTDERKNIKKKKVKDKKAQTNGHATVVIDVSDAKKSESTKSAKQASKSETPKQKKLVDIEKPVDKKSDSQKSPSKKEKKSVEGKNKRNAIEKPADFDEGEWETQPSRKDKKKKKEDDPVKDILAAMTPEKTSKKKPNLVPQKEKIEELKIDGKKAEEIIGDVIKSEVKTEVVESKKIAVDLEEPTAKAHVAEPAAPPTAAKLSDIDSADEQGKKKKGKKGKTSVSEDDAVVPEVDKRAVTAATVVADTADALPAFNELEDTWKEATQKKSKKKIRKD